MTLTPSTHRRYQLSFGTSGPAAVVEVNTPEAWWLLGDAGKTASTGGLGWVRVMGRSLFFPSEGTDNSTLRLTSLDTGSQEPVLIHLDPSFDAHNEYTVRFAIPAGLAAGTYVPTFVIVPFISLTIYPSLSL